MFKSSVAPEIEILDAVDTNAQRLVIVSNREPYTINIKGKEICFEKTPGGLVSALDPVLKQRKGLWICWEGTPKKIAEFDDVSILDNDIDWDQVEYPYQVQTVPLTEKEINHYYYGYANTRIWPLFHYFVSHCNFFDEHDWPSYYSANQKFSETVIQHTTDEDWIWVQDYHLMLVPEMIREKAQKRKIAFFLHIPFPSPEIFKILPRRDIILKGLLGSDLIGFHVAEYVQYFLDAVEGMLPESEVKVNRSNQTIFYEGRVIQVQDFPISIDFSQIESMAWSDEIQNEAKRLKSSYMVEHIAISVDRLDYTKGILENMEAIRVFFEKYPDFKKKLIFIQIAAPTRTEVLEYRQMKEEIDQAVGRINGMLAEDGWSPIHYFYRAFPMDEVLPYFLISDVAMVTPLRDGMNLVAKEYCAAKADLSGTLVLSEFTGAFSELRAAVGVNPFYIEHVADVLYHVLMFSSEEKSARMKVLRETIKKNDIHHWVQMFMSAFEHAVIDR